MRIPARHGTRYAENRAYFIALLGGKCAVCGLTDGNELEFDHIDPNLKAADITSLMYLLDRERILEEVLKCQLLCRKDHKIKTGRDLRAKKTTPTPDIKYNPGDQYGGYSIIISVKLHELEPKVKAKAKELGMTTSQLIRKALEAELSS